ncbi:MAG: MBL fold metallo-hydrolase [Candidatus Lokiarchaeota archaeon]|nr:MBL fold metallo-hydrolase [Candidatus Lokiarchaeota archaeon]
MMEIVENVYVVKPYNPNEPGCCVYMVDTKSDDGLVLIDVGLYIDPIHVIEKEGFDLKDIKHCLITHGHIDHFGACHELKKYNADIKFYAHEKDADKIEQKMPISYLNQFFANYDYEPVKLARKFKVDNEILKLGQLDFKCFHIPGHTSGSVAYFLETGNTRLLFAGDLPGTAININDGNLDDYLKSMQKLTAVDIDILCEGHEYLIKPAERVKKFIKGYMKFNENLNHLVLENPYDTKILLDLTLVTCELEFFENALDFCNYLLELDPDNSSVSQLLNKIKEHNPPKIDYIKRLIKENFSKEK